MSDPDQIIARMMGEQPTMDATALALDEWMTLDAGAKERAYEVLKQTLEGDRDRSFKAADRANAVEVTAMLVGNLLNAHQRGRSVHHSRGFKTYAGESLYYPDTLRTKGFFRLIKRLVEDELAIENKQAKGVKGARSTLRATPKLMALLGQANVTPANVCRDNASAPVFILQAKDGQKLEFDPSDKECAEAIQRLRAFNRHIENALIELVVPPDQRKSDFTHPVYRRTHLVRIFKKGSFKSYGRFHGGWWQDIDSDYRPFIRINGNETVELDFKGCAMQIRYNQAGLPMEGDPYYIEQIFQQAEKEGLDLAKVRQSIKDMTNIVFGGAFKNLENHDRFYLPSNVTNADAFFEIKYKHLVLRDRFHSYDSLDVMAIDASICDDILSRAVKDGIYVLPIHDSFIVQAHHEEWLRNVMRESWYKRLEFYPMIH